jgi:hypothetical protein
LEVHFLASFLPFAQTKLFGLASEQALPGLWIIVFQGDRPLQGNGISVNHNHFSFAKNNNSLANVVSLRLFFCPLSEEEQSGADQELMYGFFQRRGHGSRKSCGIREPHEGRTCP